MDFELHSFLPTVAQARNPQATMGYDGHQQKFLIVPQTAGEIIFLGACV
jgi:hypothetical protein